VVLLDQLLDRVHAVVLPVERDHLRVGVGDRLAVRVDHEELADLLAQVHVRERAADPHVLGERLLLSGAQRRRGGGDQDGEHADDDRDPQPAHQRDSATTPVE
jgi:hypothetical protein